ncbi:MAG: UvrD-helicase domain-containing protein [Planctomycetota bacterium]
MHHLLLDEFQDTSLVQWKVLEPLAEEILSYADGTRTFFCVGDVKQAIYGWRGGLPEILSHVETLPGVHKTPLNKSYRSAPVVIDTVNRVFRDLDKNAGISPRYQASARAWHTDFAPHTTARRDLDGAVRLLTADLRGDNERDAEVCCRHAAELVAEFVRQSPGTSVGVLVRENRSVARTIYELRKRDVFASEEGGVRLTDSPAVTTILSLLRFVDHPGDSISYFHVAASPLGTVLGLKHDSHPAEARTLSSSFRRRLLEEGYGPTLRDLSARIAPYCDARSLDRVLQLVDVAHRFDPNAKLRPSEFCSHVESIRVDDPRGSNVRVMTLHQSKGLQFDYVVLPDLDRRVLGQSPSLVTFREHPTAAPSKVFRYPSSAVREACPELEPFVEQHFHQSLRDSLSLLYVGMTRAIHRLDMVVSPNPQRKNDTYASVVRNALGPPGAMVPSETLFERGNLECLRREDVEESTGTTSPTAEPPAEPEAPPQEAQRAWRRRSPSKGRRRPFELQSGDGRTRGTVLHSWFELVEFAETFHALESTLVGSVTSLVEPEIAARWVAEFSSFVESPAARDLLSASAFRERYKLSNEVSLLVENELPFAYREDGSLVSGKIDRVVTAKKDGRAVLAEVVEFKTAALEADELSHDRREGYEQQVRAYCDAIARVHGLDPEHVHGKIAWVPARDVSPVSRDAD